MTIQNIHKNIKRHRKNSERFQWSGNSEKPENSTKIKILKFQENYHKPSLTQGSEQIYNVTFCNEKCNFFILLQCITLIQCLFVGTRSPHLNLRHIIYGKNYEVSKYMIYEKISNILSKWIDKIFDIHTFQNQWITRIVKDTKSVPTFN